MQVGGDVGEERRRPVGGQQRAQRGRKRSVGGVLARDDELARRGLPLRQERGPGFLVQGRRGSGHLVRRRGKRRRGAMAGRRVERLAQGHVDVHRARLPALGQGDRLAGDALDEPGCVRVAVVQRQGEAGAHVGRVERVLVDGLVVLLVDPLWRAVGGEHQQGHALVEGLDHGGAEVDRRGARRADQPDGAPCLLRQPQGDVAGRPLVVDHPAGDIIAAAERHGERRRAGAGRDHKVAHARGDADRNQLFDQRVGAVSHDASAAISCQATCLTGTNNDENVVPAPDVVHSSHRQRASLVRRSIIRWYHESVCQADLDSLRYR
jgi:hypothetical protein